MSCILGCWWAAVRGASKLQRCKLSISACRSYRPRQRGVADGIYHMGPLPRPKSSAGGEHHDVVSFACGVGNDAR